jgi:maleylpyruvate isomerase
VLPWLRAREVWLHAVDLGTGADLAGAPADLLDELAHDITGGLSRQDGCPVLELRPSDRDSSWQLGAGHDDAGGPVSVQGSAADLVLWLAGRSDGAGLTSAGPLPVLPAWL